MADHHEPTSDILVVKAEPQTGGSGPSWLRARLRTVLEQGYKLVLVNLADLAYIDSVMLGAIVQSYVSAVHRGGSVGIVHASERVRTLLRTTKLDGVIATYDSEEEARTKLVK